MENECKCADKTSPFKSYHCSVCDADWPLDTDFIDELVSLAVSSESPELHNSLINLGKEVQEYLETVVEYCGSCGIMVYRGDLVYSEHQRDRVCEYCWDDEGEYDV